MKKINLGQSFKDFIKNGKRYLEYLMKVDFRELFVNILILLCILVLAMFAYIPISVFSGIIKNFIAIFPIFTPVTILLYDWIFGVLGIAVSAIAFILLFNMRFEDIEYFKKQINEKPKKEEPKPSTEEEIELPKAKKTK